MITKTLFHNCISSVVNKLLTAIICNVTQLYMTKRIIYLCSGERVDGCLDACKVPFPQGVLSEHVPTYALDVLGP